MRQTNNANIEKNIYVKMLKHIYINISPKPEKCCPRQSPAEMWKEAFGIPGHPCRGNGKWETRK
jgi:hypothetical protein